MKMELFFEGHMICSILLMAILVVSVRGQGTDDDTEDSADDIDFESGDRPGIIEETTKREKNSGSTTTQIIDAKTAVDNYNHDAAPAVIGKDAQTADSGNSTTLVIAFVACAVAIIAIVAAVSVIMIRRKKKQPIIISHDSVKTSDLEIDISESGNIYEKAP